MRLIKSFGRTRVDAACSRALDIGAHTYGSVKSILADTGPAADRGNDCAIDHPNTRGPRYYH